MAPPAGVVWQVARGLADVTIFHTFAWLQLSIQSPASSRLATAAGGDCQDRRQPGRRPGAKCRRPAGTAGGRAHRHRPLQHGAARARDSLPLPAHGADAAGAPDCCSLYQTSCSEWLTVGKVHVIALRRLRMVPTQHSRVTTVARTSVLPGGFPLHTCTAMHASHVAPLSVRGGPADGPWL